MNIELPRLNAVDEWSGGGTTDEAEVVRWLVADGTRVEAGQPILDVMRDKAAVTVEAPATGVIHPLARPGDIVVAGDLIATLD